MKKRFSALVMGMLALVGGKLVYPSTANAIADKEISIKGVSESTPLFLEKFSETKSTNDAAGMLAWHSSHVSHSSHYSHSSHVSHSSHSSHFSGY